MADLAVEEVVDQVEEVVEEEVVLGEVAMHQAVGERASAVLVAAAEPVAEVEVVEAVSVPMVKAAVVLSR